MQFSSWLKTVLSRKQQRQTNSNRGDVSNRIGERTTTMAEQFLGYEGVDKVTGFRGLIIGHASYLTGCSQLLIAPRQLDKDGKRREGEWFDEQRISVDAGDKLTLDNSRTPGCDESLPPTQ